MTKFNLSPSSAARELRQTPPVRLMCVGGLLDGRTREDIGDRLAAQPARPFPRVVGMGGDYVGEADSITPIIYRKVEFAKRHVRRRFYVVEGMSDECALARIETKGLMP
mgnify:CR=1 FL=1